MKFNGVDPCSLHRAISIEKEIPPGTAGMRLETIDGSGGPVISDERMEPGEYLVRVNIFGGTQKTGWEVRELLAGWAFTKGLETAELIPTHAPDKCYDAKLKSISEPEFVHGGAKVEVRFLLPRPVMRGLKYNNRAGYPTVTIEIGGTYEATPLIWQDIEEEQNGITWYLDEMSFMSITTPLHAGDRILMDIEKESLRINGIHAEDKLDIKRTRWRDVFWPGRHALRSSNYKEIGMGWYEKWL